MKTMINPNDKLTIQEVAHRSGLAESNLRYYEQIGLIAPIEYTCSPYTGTRYNATSYSDSRGRGSISCAEELMDDEELAEHERLWQAVDAEVHILDEVNGSTIGPT